MDIKDVNALLEQRAGVFEKMRDLTVKAESEERDLTSEEAQEFDRMETDAAALEQRARRMEKLIGVVPEAEARKIKQAEENNEDEGREERKLPATLGEYREQKAVEAGK